MLYFERLDKLRFLAFFAVFWQHSFPKGLMVIDDKTTSLIKFTGGHGVHLFFVISGFLITMLAFMEKKKQGILILGISMCEEFYAYGHSIIW